MLRQTRRIAVVVSDPAFQRAVEEARREAEELIALYEESPVAFVVDRLDPVLGDKLLRSNAADQEALMIGLLQQALLETDHLMLVAEAVAGNPALSGRHRKFGPVTRRAVAGARVG